MIRFHAQVSFVRPGLHVWVPETPLKANLLPAGQDRDGTWRFDVPLDARSAPTVRAMLYDRDETSGEPVVWEGDEHQRQVLRGADGTFPPDVWLFQGTSRVLTGAPTATVGNVRVHLLTARRYREGRLYLWRPGRTGRLLDLTGVEESGPFWDVDLDGDERSLFLFKFVTSSGEFEPDYANRLYAASDGPAVWTHSRASGVATTRPTKRRLRVHWRQEVVGAEPPVMHAWQESSDFATDVPATEGPDGWFAAEVDVYERLPYGVLFHDPALAPDRAWESREVRRVVEISGDTDIWTLEGDRHTFPAPPSQDRDVEIEVSAVAPWTALDRPFRAEVRVNRARAALVSLDVNGEATAPAPPVIRFRTYPEVTTTVRLLSANGTGEQETEESRHSLVVPTGGDASRFVVGGISTVLAERPPPGPFAAPPFPLERPGAYERDGEIRFVLHAPDAARARLVGEWTGWEERPVEMRLTRDGAYWWTTLPVTDVSGGDYHGVRYRFLLDDGRPVQDPAAGWVDASAVSATSRLVDHSSFPWTDDAWETPGFDYLLLYQLHPSRFSSRHPELSPLDRIAREVDDEHGWLTGLGVTGILLMPVNEVGSTNSWGYDPAYFYAVEAGYGGPDALKRLVDTCHRHGLAVHVDLVFNHAGSTDNILWATAQRTFFDGDTAWGAMVNFDDPICRQFFQQNVAYLHREFHIDGFRFDHTHTIVHSHHRTGFVREPGSGGGWEFLAGLRRALHAAGGDRCLLSAEHLPNEWSITNYPGPMDSQWGDDFHDRLLDACRGGPVGGLARAMRLSHDASDDWYKVINYAESHDEVGNVPDRIANVAGWGRGLRMSKVAAAASILCRGIPMFFMGAEAGEHRQFRFGSADALDLGAYASSVERMRVRAWWDTCCGLRRDDRVKGPSPLAIHLADGQLLAFSRGDAADLFVVLNFGGWAGHRHLWELNLPAGTYRELWNSTWPAFAVEDEDEHGNGGRGARLRAHLHLHVPDYGVVVLERV